LQPELELDIKNSWITGKLKLELDIRCIPIDERFAVLQLTAMHRCRWSWNMHSYIGASWLEFTGDNLCL